MATINVREAWALAEASVFGKLLEATASDDGQNGFLGAEGPTNSWSLYVGGGAADGARAGCYSALNLSARIVGTFAERADCIAWAGQIFGVLRDTSNMNELTGTNVTWFRPTEWPGEPQETEDENGDRVFVQAFPMELIAHGSDTYV